MNFNNHSNLQGNHAFLSASKYHWVNYDDDKLAESYSRALAAQKGTRLHELAASLIQENIKLPRSKKTLNAYVNDAIGFRMVPEQILYFSENCFGTADAICFDGKILRIHDLKTGVTATHMEQLEVYASLFFLEYDISPKDVAMELRIYQNDEVIVHNPEVDDINFVMNRIIRSNDIINQIKREAL